MGSIGSTLKNTRKNLGLTLRRVEELSGISNAYLSQLENDKIKNPSGNVLSRLSNLYKIPLKVLLNSGNDLEDLDEENNDIANSFAQKIAFSSKDLTEDEKNEVLKYLEFIKSHRR